MHRLLSIVMCIPTVALASHLTVDRDPADYFALGIRETHLQNLALVSPSCSVGVNCPESGPSCGFLFMQGGRVAEPGQVVGDKMCADKDLFAVFRNNAGECDTTCAVIAHAGPAADCTAPFAPPILADLDGDGALSCDAACAIDRDDVALACGVSLPLPACNPALPVFVKENGDCIPSSLDVQTGNYRCDLAPGVYGDVRLQSGGRLEFAAGTTVICSFNASRASRIKSTGPATILVPGQGRVRLGRLVDAGSGCGVLHVVTEEGRIHLGRGGDQTLDACSIAGDVLLGHGNSLRGNFVANTIATDKHNEGRCCAQEAPPTTTTSSTTVTSTSIASTTTLSSTTSTSAASTSSTTGTSPATTTTTLPGDGFTRTIGFYGTHPDVTGEILAVAGSLSVCGHVISDVDTDHGHSAIEALCVIPRGNQRLQLARQLTGAALTMAAGGATFTGFDVCNARCADPNATATALSGCVDETSAFNQSGDSQLAPFDPPGRASTGPCQRAQRTACTLLAPTSCAVP